MAMTRSEAWCQGKVTAETERMPGWVRAQSTAAQVAGQTLLVRVAGSTDRIANAYTLKVAEPVADALREYALVIKGRVANFDDGQPVHCWNSASDSPPICLIAVEFTNIAFEDPSDGKILAEWQ